MYLLVTILMTKSTAAASASYDTLGTDPCVTFSAENSPSAILSDAEGLCFVCSGVPYSAGDGWRLWYSMLAGKQGQRLATRGSSQWPMMRAWG